MSRKIKKMLSVICVMCLLVNLLMVHASGDMHMEMGRWRYLTESLC